MQGCGQALVARMHRAAVVHLLQQKLQILQLLMVQPSSVPHPMPRTLHPSPYTLHPTPYTYTLHPTPYTYTLHLTPYTLHPSPYTLHPTPYTYTLHPTGGHALVAVDGAASGEAAPFRVGAPHCAHVHEKYLPPLQGVSPLSSKRGACKTVEASFRRWLEPF